MLKNLQIGMSVKWIDQAWEGVIKDIRGNRVLVLHEDGFEEWELSTKLLPQGINQSLDKIYDSKNELQYLESRPIKSVEIDLHIENLTVQWEKIPQEKILDYQILAFKEEFQRCIQNKMNEFIVIHGKGRGILRDHLVNFLKMHPNVSFRPMLEGRYKNSAIQIYFDKHSQFD